MVTNRGGSRASYTLGVETMKNGRGKMTSGTQRYRGISGKSDGLEAKWTTCGLVKDNVVEAGLAELVRDVVRCVEGDKCVDVLEASETWWKAKKELNGWTRGGHASATQRLEGGVFNF